MAIWTFHHGLYFQVQMIAALIPPVVLAALLALSGWLMGLRRRWWLPPVVAMFIFLVNPIYMEPLYKETVGLVMLAGAAFMEFVGVMIIKKIITIEV